MCVWIAFYTTALLHVQHTNQILNRLLISDIFVSTTHFSYEFDIIVTSEMQIIYVALISHSQHTMLVCWCAAKNRQQNTGKNWAHRANVLFITLMASKWKSIWWWRNNNNNTRNSDSSSNSNKNGTAETITNYAAERKHCLRNNWSKIFEI